MNQKQQIAQFDALIESVFSKKMERITDQKAFTRKYQNLYKREYDVLRESVFSAATSAFLWELMKSYLNAYGRNAGNPNLIHYYKSDQLYLFLITQSAKVDDPSLFETWAGSVKGRGDRSFNSFWKRYADLDPYFQREIDVFIAQEKEKRRVRRSLLDLLRDEYRRVHKMDPTLEQLRAFDPPPTTRWLIENQIATVRNRWIEARNDRKDEKLDAFSKALNAISDYFRDLGKQDVLGLFQAVKQLQLPADTPQLSEDRLVLFHGLYAIACVRLHGAALVASLYQKNLEGFTTEEFDFFAGEVRRSRFRYKSNIVNALSSKLRDPTVPIGAIAGMLKSFLLAKTRLPGLTLVDLDSTLNIQKKWMLVRDLTEQIGLASRNNDVAKLTATMSDPRNREAVEALRDIGSTKLPLTSGQDLGSRVLTAGSQLGMRGAAGAVSVAYIHPKDKRIFLEFSALKPQLFEAPHSWVADQQYGQKIAEIYQATIGIVHLTELMFLAMGFLPVLIEAGFVGLIYEIAFTYATQKLEEQLEKIDPVLAKVLALAIAIFAPRPNFKPKLKYDVAERADASLLGEKLNFKPNRSVDDNGLHPGSRRIDDLSGPELDAFLDQILVHDEMTVNNCGIPLTRNTLKEVMEKFKPGYSKFPREWRTVIAECTPLRNLIKAVLKDPEGNVRLVRIGEKQKEALPFKFQRSTMGSDHELQFKLNGQEYRLDGIIKGENDTWFIGESKFTFKDMMESAEHPMASLHKSGRANPTTSYHYRFIEKAQAQFKRYSAVAKKFGFDGVAIMTNTEFLWATFEQTTRHLKNVEIFLSRLDEMDEFAAMTDRAMTPASKATGDASRATRGRATR